MSTRGSIYIGSNLDDEQAPWGTEKWVLHTSNALHECPQISLQSEVLQSFSSPTFLRCVHPIGRYTKQPSS